MASSLAGLILLSLAALSFRASFWYQQLSYWWQSFSKVGLQLFLVMALVLNWTGPWWTQPANVEQLISGQLFPLKQFGGKLDGQTVTDGNMTSGSAVLTSASGKFVATDANKLVAVEGASSSAATFNVLGARILSIQSATQVTLDTAATQSTVLNGALVTWGTNDSPAFVKAIAAAALVASPDNPAFILLTPGRCIVGQSNTDFIDLSTGATTDYIGLAGTDAYACIIDRPMSQGVGNAVIEAAVHSRIATLTLQSKVSRLIHWDKTTQGARLLVDGCLLPKGGGGNGISAGIVSGSNPLAQVSRLTVQNCVFGDGGGGTAQISCHNNTPGDGSSAIIEFISNKWSQSATVIMTVDMTIGTGNVALFAYGNSVNWFEVDDSADLTIKVADANAAYINVYTDGSVRIDRTAIGANTKFWNYIHYTPQLVRAYPTTGNNTTEASVMVYDPANDNLKQTTTKGDLWPVIIACQRSVGLGSVVATWAPILCTGAYAEVTCDTGAVALNDVIVSSVTAQQATVDNTQTDPRRILGWALQTKGAGASGRVRIRRNQAVMF